MKFLSFTPILVSLASFTAAIPQPKLDSPLDLVLGALGLNGLVGNGKFPLLETTIHSPECANTNNGTYLCCESTVNGGIPIVVEASALTNYPLTKNTINGLVNCKQSFQKCNPGTKLCCGVIALIPTIALFCQQAN